MDLADYFQLSSLFRVDSVNLFSFQSLGAIFIMLDFTRTRRFTSALTLIFASVFFGTLVSPSALAAERRSQTCSPLDELIRGFGLSDNTRSTLPICAENGLLGSLNNSSSVNETLFAPMAPTVAPLWYNGDRDGTTQALPNGLNYAGFPDARVYSDFIVTNPNGWIVSSLFSNNLITNPASPVTQAAWEIRTGVGVGTGGTLLYSGTSAATKVATGRSISGFNEYTIKVSGLNIVLPAGTYFLNVAPIGPGVDNSYLSATTGLNAIGTPAGNNANEFWQNPAGVFQSTFGVGNDFSQGVIGNVVVPCVTPSTTYVDDDWATLVTGDDPPGPATYFGCDAFATVQGGVNGVATGGNVIVAAGTYNEAQVVINRSMTVTGAGAASTTINGLNTAIPNAGLVRIVTPSGDTGTATFQGFKVTNPGLSPETGGTHVAIYARPLNAAAKTRITNNTILGVNSSDNGYYTILNVGAVEFDHNIMTNIGFNPIVIERAGGPTDVHDNNISGHASTAYFNFTYFGTDVTAQQRVANNTISGATASAIVFNSSYPAVAPFTGRFTNVSVTGNTITQLAANRTGITLLNQVASGNGPAGAIENPVISGNTITGTGAANSKGIRISGLVTNPSITGNDIRSLARGISGEVINSHSATGSAFHLNNIVGNTTGLYWDPTGSVDAENNWWGCNAGPGNPGCDTIGGGNTLGADTDPRMILAVSASPASVPISGSTTITADMTKNSSAGSPMGALPNIPATFSASNGNMAPGMGTITSGLATSIFTSNSVYSGSGCAMVDNQQICTPVTVDLGTTSGKVTLQLNGSVPVPGVALSATDGMATVSDTSDSNGNYSLFGFTPGTWTVTPSKAPYNVYSYNGIFSNDATLVSRHVVGLITLNPDQIKAAKVAGLANLSSFDAALIAQHIVGIPNPINKTGKWFFTPSSTTPNVLIDNTQNYGATLFGDVNGSWDPLGPRPASVLTDPERIKNAVRVSLPRIKAAPGADIFLPLMIENLKGRFVDSFQFDVEYDPNVITPAEAAANIEGTLAGNMSIAFNSPQKGLLKVVVYGAFPASGDGIYVNLRFHLTGVEGSASPLSIRNFRLNDGTDDIYAVESRIVVRSAESADIARR